MQINLVPDLSLFAVMAIFIVNYFVVARFFVKPINDVLEAREHDTRTSHDVFEAAMAKFNEATARMEERLHIAKREASAVRDRFRGEANAHRSSMLEKTTKDADAIVRDAEDRLSHDVAEARNKIVRDSESLAHMAAERILGRAV